MDDGIDIEETDAYATPRPPGGRTVVPSDVLIEDGGAAVP